MFGLPGAAAGCLSYPYNRKKQTLKVAGSPGAVGLTTYKKAPKKKQDKKQKSLFNTLQVVKSMVLYNRS